MDADVQIAQIYERINPLIADDKTHLLLRLGSKANAVIYKLPEGMYIAEAADKTAILGENPNKREARVFLNHDLAVAHIVRAAGTDANVYDYDVDEGSPIIIPSGESYPTANGSIRMAPQDHQTVRKCS